MGRFIILVIGMVVGLAGAIWADRDSRFEPFISKTLNRVLPPEEKLPEGDEILSRQVRMSLNIDTCFERNPEYSVFAPEWMTRDALGPLTSVKEAERPFPDLQKYPGLVKIEQILSSSGSQRHHCAGARVGKHWIMTANHCVKMRGPSGQVYDMIVVVPEEDVAREGTAISPVNAAVCHSAWYDTTGKFDDDIALLYVEDVRALNGVDIASLDSYRAPLDAEYYQNAYFGGWGKNGANRFFQGGKLFIESIGEMFLLGNNNGGFAPCVGDSGGPLFVETEYGPKVVGVLSAVTDDTCRTYDKAFYIRVKSFGDWINSAKRNCEQDGRFVCATEESLGRS
jgi:hypothetical protein